jgi:hypothetical protein
MARGGGAVPEPDRPVADLVEQLVDDGKAYAHAEAALIRAKVEHRVASYRSAAILGGIAFLLAIGAAIALSLTLVLILSELIGPYAGGVVATLLVGGAAALTGSYAKKAFDRAGH